MRTFLSHFSTVEHLTPNGCVYLTLCNGQGGTPADEPLREWYNSWQVVAQAAHAGLILTDVANFNTNDYPEYSSTGFRLVETNQREVKGKQC